ncbi:tRNA uridine 5-carboxymethylaminomethyl modification enzyme GidA [Escherichia coli P12b]|nr:tRNA uridine 5-carboxymethylaminomethyl modification enzyme GidA [Escherichia coli P12b]
MPGKHPLTRQRIKNR